MENSGQTSQKMEAGEIMNNRSIRDVYLNSARPSTLAAMIADIDTASVDSPMSTSDDCLRAMLYGCLCENVGPEQADILICSELKEL